MSQRWDIRLLYDGGCPLCAREIAFLARRDRERGRIRFEDISATDFDASRYELDPSSVMARMHAVLPDGRVVQGMEVFRRAYAAVGLGWLLAPTGWPGLRRFFDWVYGVFARNRLRWTARDCACEIGSQPDPKRTKGAPTTRPGRPSTFGSIATD